MQQGEVERGAGHIVSRTSRCRSPPFSRPARLHPAPGGRGPPAHDHRPEQQREIRGVFQVPFARAARPTTRIGANPRAAMSPDESAQHLAAVAPPERRRRGRSPPRPGCPRAPASPRGRQGPAVRPLWRSLRLVDVAVWLVVPSRVRLVREERVDLALEALRDRRGQNHNQLKRFTRPASLGARWTCTVMMTVQVGDQGRPMAHGDSLDVVRLPDGDVGVGLKRICEIVGIGEEGQRQRLSRTAKAGARWSVTCMMKVTAADARRTTRASCRAGLSPCGRSR